MQEEERKNLPTGGLIAEYDVYWFRHKRMIMYNGGIV